MDSFIVRCGRLPCDFVLFSHLEKNGIMCIGFDISTATMMCGFLRTGMRGSVKNEDFRNRGGSCPLESADGKLIFGCNVLDTFRALFGNGICVLSLVTCRFDVIQFSDNCYM